MDWTDDLPDGCPPSDADAPNGVVVRLVEGDPPTARDFVTLAERQPEKEWPSDELDCQARGLSVYRDLEDAAKTRRRIPALRNCLLAVADIGGEPGVIKATPPRREPTSTHHTWWVPASYAPAERFSVREE